MIHSFIRFLSHLVGCHFDNLPPTSNRKDFYNERTEKAIDMTPKELEQWLDTLETEDTVPEYYFSNPAPYAKVEPIPYEQRRHNFHFDADGHICVKNISAYWIPELTVTEEIKGTIYTVTGSYEGETDFISKLERIIAKKCAEEMEGAQ